MPAALLVAAAVLAACGGGDNTATSAEAQAVATKTGSPQLAAIDASAWTTIAQEGESYTLSASQTIRYGSGDAWIVRTASEGGPCTNQAFGYDPLYGVVKQCQVAGGGATTWIKIADENQPLSVNGTQTVRYGSGTSWTTREVSAGATCSNAFFGNDPLYGTVKECDVATSAPLPPVASSSAAVCTPPIALADTGSAAVVGDGSPASCTEAALRAALSGNAAVKFSCGPAPVTIAIRATIELPPGRDTVIDGENRVTLDGGGQARILSLYNGNYRTNTHGLTLQRIALRNAKAPGAGYVAPNPSNPACAYGYAEGSGAAVVVRDARLHVIDVDFQNNAAASPGPDVGGGAISAVGSLDVVVSGSRFSGNSGANAGAIGALQSNLRVYNSSFTGNSASGVGQNYAGGAAATCPGVGHAGQGGAGGNGGAIAIDGSDDGDVTICGSTFDGNHANELAGALFRTANWQPRAMSIDRTTFKNNSARQGGAAFLMNQAPLDIVASTFSDNKAEAFGAAQFFMTRFSIVNTTFSGNSATLGLGGALFLGATSGDSQIVNSTFAENTANGGPGYFSGALFGDSWFPIRNTVFVNNATLDWWNPMQCTFTPASGSNDMQWPLNRLAGGAADTPCVNGIAFADPLLAALANNGGPTATRAPASNSPLRNAGTNCPATDQRGNPRNTSSCTIGAIE